MAREYTTVEGVLKASLIPSVYVANDPLTDQPTVVWPIDPETRARAADLVGRRVSFSGEAAIDEDGFPTRMIAVEIREFPDPDGLPTFGPGEAVDIAGGVDAVEYVRRLRDEK